jgi:hypothetical protein
MKTRTFILLACLSVAFSCSVSEEADTQGPDTVSLKAGSPVMEILSKEGGKESLAALFSSSRTSKGNGNGVVFIPNGGDYVIGLGIGNNVIFLYEIDENNFYRSPIDIQLMPNGDAQFKSSSTDFVAEIYDASNGAFDLIYSNLCFDERVGNLHINLKAPFELITDDPFVDFDYYRPVFSEASSANNLQMTVVVDDRAFNLDEVNLTWECNESATIQKRIKLTSLFTPGGTLNIQLRGL